MNKKKGVLISKRLLLLLLLPAMWFFITSGIFAFVIGKCVSGSIHILIAGAGVYLLLSNRAQIEFIGKTLPSYVLISYLLYLSAIGLFKFGDLLFADLVSKGQVNIPDVILFVAALGYLVILAFVVVDVARLMLSSTRA